MPASGSPTSVTRPVWPRLCGCAASARCSVRDYDAARTLLEEARAGFEAAGDRRGAAWALQNLAWCEFYTGRAGEAEAQLRRAIEEFRELGDRGGLGWATGLLAWTRLQQGDRAEAQLIGDQVLEDIRGGGDRWATGVMLTLAALTRLWGGAPQEAVVRAEEAYELCEDLGDIFLRLQATGVLGRSLVHSGRVEEGLTRLEEAVDVLGNDPSASDQVFFMMTMLGVAVRLGDVALASQVREEMRRAGIADHELYGEGEVSLALLTLQEGDPAGALAGLVAEETGEQEGYRGAATALALAAAGRGEDALAAARAVLDSDVPTYLDRLDARVAQALTFARRDDTASARAVLADAAAEVDSTGDRLASAIVLMAKSSVARATGADDAVDLGADASEALCDLGIEAEGWRSTFDRAAGLRSSAAAG